MYSISFALLQIDREAVDYLFFRLRDNVSADTNKDTDGVVLKRCE